MKLLRASYVIWSAVSLWKCVNATPVAASITSLPIVLSQPLVDEAHLRAKKEAIADRYIVRLKKNKSPSSLRNYLHSRVASSDASCHPSRQYPNNILNEFKIGQFSALTVRGCSPSMQSDLEEREEVAWVEPDTIFRVALTPNYSKQFVDSAGPGAWDSKLSKKPFNATKLEKRAFRLPHNVEIADQTEPLSWGLVRISHRLPEYGEPYRYPSAAGEGVHVFVLDTGLDEKNPDFNGRAKLEVNFVETEPAEDLSGHGTHVAGTIAGTKYGVAKKAYVHGVKILDRYGLGSISGILAGVDWVARSGYNSSILNLSLVGPRSQAVDDAISALVKEHKVAAFVAAGNSGDDACKYSPSGNSDVFSVGASSKNDEVADFSNSGNCVRVYAPGVDIVSDTVSGDNTPVAMQGTSMSSPHVAGIAALFLSLHHFESPHELYRAIESVATKGTLQMNKALPSSNNLLAYSLPKSSQMPVDVSFFSLTKVIVKAFRRTQR
ncbi:uncharacterized protein VTP21DRAFT_4417 [Calcarisporiella thermophila]|uniref:uncharacterized protein n=1 Tax=Calcarisporiella thermophila TaxID=911321 RepID=UPI00374486FF